MWTGFKIPPLIKIVRFSDPHRWLLKSGGGGAPRLGTDADSEGGLALK